MEFTFMLMKLGFLFQSTWQ